MALATLVVMAVLTRGCHETSESQAVGLAHCISFGHWDQGNGVELALEAPRPGFGWTQLQIDRAATDTCLPVGRNCASFTHLPVGALGGQRLSIGTFEVDVPVVRWGPLWLGPMAGLSKRPGWSSRRVTPLGQTTLDNPELWTLGAVLGTELRVRRIALHAALALAAADFTLDATTANGDQVVDHSWCSVQLRAGLEVWVTPGLALGAAASVDVLRTDYVSARVFMVVPLHMPFGGVNSIW